MGGVNTNVGVQHLDYDQMLSQLQSLKGKDVLCLKDGKLSAWQPGQGDAKTPNTKEVMDAVFKSVTAKIDGTGGDYEKYRSHLIGAFDKAQKAASSKKNTFLVEDLKDFLSGFKDLNTAPKVKTATKPEVKTKEKTATKTEEKAEVKAEEVKDIGSVPKLGETVKMTRAELEKNLDSWIKAGYRVTVKVPEQGTYQLEGKSTKDDNPHTYDALFSSADGKVINERRSFELPDSSYSVSQAVAKPEVKEPEIEVKVELPEVKTDDKSKQKPVPQSEIKPEIKVEISTEKKIKKEPKEEPKIEQEVKIKSEQKVKNKMRITKQTTESNSCFIWSVANSVKSMAVGMDNVRRAVGELDPKDNDKFVVFDDKGNLQKQSIKALRQSVSKMPNGKEFLTHLDKLQEGLERNLALYSYVENKEYQAEFDLAHKFPVGDSNFAAKTFGLQLLSEEPLSFKCSSSESNPKQSGEKIEASLKSLDQHLKRGNVVTLNMDGAHFVTVCGIDTKRQLVTYADSMDGTMRTEDLGTIARQYSTHGADRTLSFSVYGVQTAVVQKNVDDVIALFDDIVSDRLAKKNPTSILGKALLQKGLTMQENGYLKLHEKALYFPKENENQAKAKAVKTINDDDFMKNSYMKPMVGNNDQSVIALLSSINDLIENSKLV